MIHEYTTPSLYQRRLIQKDRQRYFLIGTTICYQLTVEQRIPISQQRNILTKTALKCSVIRFKLFLDLCKDTKSKWAETPILSVKIHHFCMGRYTKYKCAHTPFMNV